MSWRRPLFAFLMGLATLASFSGQTQADETVRFRDGVSGYAGTQDLHLAIPENFTGNGHLRSQHVTDPDNPQWVWDFEGTWGEGTREFSSGMNRSGRGDHVGLLRFDSIFGDGAGQIPPGAIISSATLRLFPDNSPSLERKPGDGANLHEIVIDWGENVRWDSFGAQPGPDIGSDFSPQIVAHTGTTGADLVLDVTASLAAWSQDPASNRGWLFMPTGVQDVISVSGSSLANVNKVTVDLEINTPQRGEIVATLRHGEYTSLLLDRVRSPCLPHFGSFANNFDVTLDDDAAADIHGAPDPPDPLTGSWKPDGACTSLPLCTGGGTGGLCGASADGDWVLNVYDEWIGSGTASLVSWGITLSDGINPDESYSAAPALVIPRRHTGSSFATAIWSSESPTEALRPELTVTFTETASFSPPELETAPMAGLQFVLLRIPEGSNSNSNVIVNISSDNPAVAAPTIPVLFLQGGATALNALIAIGQAGSATLSTSNDGGFLDASLLVEVGYAAIRTSANSYHLAAASPDESLRVTIPLGANASSAVNLTIASSDPAVVLPLGAVGNSLPLTFAPGAANWQDVVVQFGGSPGSASLTASDDGMLLPSAVVAVILSVEAAQSFELGIEPYIQLGNAPLGAATDQFAIAWQSTRLSLGGTTADRFTVEHRKLGDANWIPSAQDLPIPTGSESRLTHSATLTGLDFDAQYEYRVTHLRNEVAHAVYQATVPTRKTGGSFRFTAFGNTGQGTPTQHQMAQILANQNPDLHLLLGDNLYWHGEFEHLQPRIGDVYGSLMASRPFHFTLGNHDRTIQNGQANRDFFFEPENGPTLPNELNYSFDYGDVHFVSVNSGSGLGSNTIEVDIAPWLAADLAASNKTWKVVYTHEPPVTRDPYGVDREEQPLVRDHLLKAAVENGAQLFLAGATHSMQRYLPISEVTAVDPFVKWTSCEDGDGTALVYAGTGSWFRGAPGPIPPLLDPPMEVYAPQLGVLVVDVDSGTSMTVRMIDEAGVEFDSVDLLPCVNPQDCQCPTQIQLFGIARGGFSVSITIAGVQISVVTGTLMPAPALVTALANAVNTNPTLMTLGFTATADENTLASNATIKNLVINDPGIAETVGELTLPSFSPPGLLALALTLSAAGWVALHRRRRAPGRGLGDYSRRIR